MLENTYGVNRIEFEKEITAYCPLGNDFYRANISVTIWCNDRLVDFCIADKFINGLNGNTYIVEHLTADVFDYFKPYSEHLEVTVQAKSDTHFPVSVTKAF